MGAGRNVHPWMGGHQLWGRVRGGGGEAGAAAAVPREPATKGGIGRAMHSFGGSASWLLGARRARPAPPVAWMPTSLVEAKVGCDAPDLLPFLGRAEHVGKHEHIYVSLIKRIRVHRRGHILEGNLRRGCGESVWWSGDDYAL